MTSASDFGSEEEWEIPADPFGDSGAAALAHLQAAVLEVVAASRAALDVVEKLIKDPEALAPLVNTAAGLGQVVADMLRARAQPAGAPPPDPSPEPPSDGVQRIRIS